MNSLFLFTLALISIVNFSFGSQLQLVNKDGTIKQAQFLNSFFNQHKESIKRIFGVIDLLSTNSDNSLSNAILTTKFNPSNNEISIDVIDEALIVYCSFDHMVSTKFCGSKAIDLMNSLNIPKLVLLSLDNIDENLLVLEQTLTKLLDNSLENVKHKLYFVVDTKIEETIVKDKMKAKLLSIWSNLGGNNSLEDKIEFEILKFDSKDPVSIETIKYEILSLEDGDQDFSAQISSLANKFINNWSLIPKSPKTPMNKNQLESLFLIESTYFKVSKQAEEAMILLQKRVNKGRTIANFPSRINNIIGSVYNEFNKPLIGSTMIKERAKKLQSIREWLLTSSNNLFEQQALIIEADCLKKYKSDIMKHYSSVENFNPSSEIILQLIRKSSFDFKVKISHIEDSSLSLKLSQQKYTSFIEKLENLAKEFPESSEAKLIDIKRMEKQVNKRRRKKSPLGPLALGFSLVGMFRPAGLGNLQGFASYATSILGFPLDFLLGVQNDGESFETIAEDRENPILRLQPKVNFELNF